MNCEPWVGDRVQYSSRNEPPQEAEIIAITSGTDAGIRILIGRQAGQELVAPWGVIVPKGNPWQRFDRSDKSTLPENGSKFEIQTTDRKVFELVYGESLSAIVGQVNSPLIEIPEEAKEKKMRWRYLD